MYRYTLEKRSKKHICPHCGQKRFVRYIDSQTGEYLGFKVGRCDREISCGYHFPPKSFFKEQKQQYAPIAMRTAVNSVGEKEMSLHKVDELEQTLTKYEENNFIHYMNKKFGASEVATMLNDYKIGTAVNWYNSTIFWQIDQNQKIRGGKIIKYGQSGKRTRYINWVHAIQIKKNEIPEFNLKQCLFGLHLLDKYEKTVAIVESEKTACVMSLLFEKYLWMATGSLNGLTLEKLNALRERKIILYPDLGKDCVTGSPFDRWKQKCHTFKQLGFDIDVSDLLERKSTEFHREKGYDLADYFLENQSNKPTKIMSEQQQKFIDLYLRNHNLKTLIDVFDLTDINGDEINFDTEGF